MFRTKGIGAVLIEFGAVLRIEQAMLMLDKYLVKFIDYSTFDYAFVKPN